MLREGEKRGDVERGGEEWGMLREGGGGGGGRMGDVEGGGGEGEGGRMGNGGKDAGKTLTPF